MRALIHLLVFAGISASAAPVEAAPPVLDQVKGGSKLLIGYRESSVPFSFLDARKQPVGYALDICAKLAEAIRKNAGVKNLPVELVMVSSANRIELVEQGKVHLECGSTTNNAERRTKVAFTIPHFITGARMLVKADSSIERIEDLAGKTLVSTKGSTPLKAVTQANQARLMAIKIAEVPDHVRGVEMVESGAADAFVMDDVLLYGLAASRAAGSKLKVVGKFLTTEPLAIMLPKNDPEFSKLIDNEMRRLILNKEIYPIYERWFSQPIPPTNTALNMPPSYLLKDFWKYPNAFVPF